VSARWHPVPPGRACLAGHCIPIIAPLLLIACGESTAAEPVVRDSAGITIVENSDPLWGDGEAWRLSEKPVLEIGVVEGPDAYQLDRVMGAARLPDGGVAVANAGSSEIRFFDRSGRFRRAAGGPGEGPGEFRIPFGVWPVGEDSLLVTDPMLRRGALYDLDGGFGRTFNFEDAGSNPRPVGPLGDRNVLNFDHEYSNVLDGPVQQMGLLRLHTVEGALIDSLGRHPTFRSVPITFPDGGFVISGYLFRESTSVASAGEVFYVGTSGRSAVAPYAPDGRLVRRIEWPDRGRDVEPGHVELHRAERLEAASPERREHERRVLEATPVPERFPAHGDLLADRGGNLWIQRYRRPGETGPDRWLVFDTDGRMLGDVEVPLERVLEIGDDHVLGVYRDDLDVEYVRMYRLTKPEAAS